MRKDVLLSRDAFRKAVFDRDHNTCVFCSLPAVDAHHILERKLWPDGGYYLNNGASVCEQHHWDCENCIISVEQVRKACNIIDIVLPPYFSENQIYDKWGNQKLTTEDAGAIKYPRTYHFPWSQNLINDDRMLETIDQFEGQHVIATVKMDGENTTMTREACHARSLDSGAHPSRTWVRSFWGSVRHNIPEGWRVCGENLYAKHSILYTNLTSYFQGFSVWNDKNICLSWKETKEWFELLGIQPVQEIYDGIYSEEAIKNLWDPEKGWEGYVVRFEESFPQRDFNLKVGKFVRKGHVQTDEHWMQSALIPNKLAY